MAPLYYLLTAVSYLAICAVAVYMYCSWRMEKRIDNISKHIGVLGILFLLPALMNFLWAFSELRPSVQDALFVNGMFYIILPAVMLIIIYQLTGNRNLLYLLALFGITIISLPYSFSKFFISLMIMANLLFLIISIDVLIIRRYHIQFAGVIGALYALTMLFFTFLLYFDIIYTDIWWWIPNLMLALMLFMLHLDKKYYALISPKAVLHRKPHVKKAFLGLMFTRYTLYILSVASLTFIATVSVHELGHAITAVYYDCEPARIIYDLREPPYTEINCASNGLPLFIITLAGPVIVFALSAVFFFTEGPFTTRLAELMLGFGFLISYTDFLDLGLSDNIVVLIMLASLMIIFSAITNFSLFYIRQHIPLQREMESDLRRVKMWASNHEDRRRSRSLV